MAIVLDPNDLSKTVLLSSKDLASTSIELEEITSGKTVGALKYVQILHKAGDDEPIPMLHHLDATSTVEAFEAQRSKFYTPPTKPEVASKEIKKEDDDANEANDDDGVTVDWSNMYRIFFEIIEAGPRTKRLFFSEDASEALIQVSAVIAIATKYDALYAISSMFQTDLIKWIGNNTLYSAIAEQPCAWLKVGLAMEEQITFQESFVHLVGDWNSYESMVAETGLPERVLALIEKKATNLRLRRNQVDRKLFGITLLAEIKVAPGRKQKGAVSTKHEPLSWMIVNLFRDWIAAHLTVIDNVSAAGDTESTTTSSNKDANDINHELTPTCPDHKPGQSPCLTLAGFYRTLAKADDSYLPAEEVMKLLAPFNNKAFAISDSDVRAALKELKASAAKIVAPLVKTELRSTGAGGLEYLTCVDLGDVSVADVKGEVEEKGEDGEEMEE